MLKREYLSRIFCTRLVPNSSIAFARRDSMSKSRRDVFTWHSLEPECNVLLW